MKGDNPIRAPLSHDGSTLEVKHIFPTLQGEGPNTGVPAVFIRLGGCNLACDFCDTDFEGYQEMSVTEILERVIILSLRERVAPKAPGEGIAPPQQVRERHPLPKGEGKIQLAVITGGEPLRQNIAPLCEALLAEGFFVQIETNGTLYRPLPEAVEIVCSPKNTGGGYFPIRGDLLPRVNAFKFIISKHSREYDHVAEVGQGQYKTPVYVQPMDEYNEKLNAENLALALTLAQQHGYRLSLQTHKLLGIE